jgi:hypothetical protein
MSSAKGSFESKKQNIENAFNAIKSIVSTWNIFDDTIGFKLNSIKDNTIFASKIKGIFEGLNHAISKAEDELTEIGPLDVTEMLVEELAASNGISLKMADGREIDCSVCKGRRLPVSIHMYVHFYALSNQ